MSNRRKTREERLHQFLGGKRTYSKDPKKAEVERQQERSRLLSRGNRVIRARAELSRIREAAE